MKKWHRIALGIIAIFLILSIIFYIIYGFFGITTKIFFTLTLILIVSYGSLNYKTVIAFLQNKGHTTFLYQISRFLLIVGILIFTYLFSKGIPWKLDLTISRLYSLSEETLNVIKGFTNELNVYYFKPSDKSDPILDYQENLLKTYAEKSPYIKINTADPSRDKALAEEFKINEKGMVVFEYGGNRVYVGIRKIVDMDPQSSKITYKGEEAFTSALKSLLISKPQIVYVLQGHGEINLYDKSGFGYQNILDRMKEDGIKVASLNLMQIPSVPIDCGMLIIGNPTYPILVDEMDKINNYIHRGGSVLVLLEYQSHITINDILRQMGVFYIQNMVIEDEDYMPEFGKTKFLPQIVPHEITMPIIRKNIPVFFQTAVGILELPEKERTSKDTYLISPILKSSKNSYGEINQKEIVANKVSQDDNDLKGPLVVACAIKKIQTNISITLSNEVTNITESRMVVFGDSDFINNDNINTGANLDIFLNAVKYLLKREVDIAIRPKVTAITAFQLTSSERRFITFLAIAVVLLYIVPGIVIVYRRKQKVKG